MAEPSTTRLFWARIAPVLAIWLVLTLALTGQASLVIYYHKLAHTDLPTPTAVSLTELFVNQAAECCIWAALTFGVLFLVRRFPFGQGRWLRSLAVHVVASVAVALVQTLLALAIARYLRWDLPPPWITSNVLVYYFVAKLNNNLIIYWAIVAVGHIVRYYRQFRERELRSSELEARLAQTQLQVLKMQLHPHFLFNTLNAITALIHQDVDLADRMIARLGDLLRTTLDNANQQEVSLRQEMDMVKPYLEIEQARLGSRLTVHLDIDPAAMDAQVPNLILQPLVENAIRHGIAPRTEPGRIEIQAHRENGLLRLSIADDGPGLQDAEKTAGIGLANTRARLAKLYGDGHRLEFSAGRHGGLCVAISIPFKEAQA